MKLIESDKIENITCDKVIADEIDDITKASKEMFDLIKKDKRAIALAAPQVGIFKQFFVFKSADNSYRIVINPLYTKNGSKIKSRESCLSYGIDNFTDVKRYKSIRIKHDAWIDNKLVSKTDYVKGFPAIMMQHETDHLFGRTIFNQ